MKYYPNSSVARFKIRLIAQIFFIYKKLVFFREFCFFNKKKVITNLFNFLFNAQSIYLSS